MEMWYGKLQDLYFCLLKCWYMSAHAQYIIPKSK